MSLLCYNKGCGKSFDLTEQRSDQECCYHPGEPYFHDAYKIWTCCQQKSTDFTQFLAFKGCTKGRHNPEKPIKIEEKKVVKEVRESKEVQKNEELPRPPDDTPFVPLNVNIKANSSILQTNSNSTSQVVVCLNKGCGVSQPNTSVCQYHPGVPIFHEGSKYWSCCQRKTTDFDSFLNQQGCETGDHKWGTSTSDKKSVNWRVDWFQTSNDVTITIFAKNSQKVNAECNGVIARINIDDQWSKEWKLFTIVNPNSSYVSITQNKVEIILKKAQTRQWSKLEIS